MSYIGTHGIKNFSHLYTNSIKQVPIILYNIIVPAIKIKWYFNLIDYRPAEKDGNKNWPPENRKFGPFLG